jgi:hypothetical protein
MVKNNSQKQMKGGKNFDKRIKIWWLQTDRCLKGELNISDNLYYKSYENWVRP